MKRYLAILLGLLTGVLPAVAWAEGVSGYSRGQCDVILQPHGICADLRIA